MMGSFSLGLIVNFHALPFGHDKVGLGVKVVNEIGGGERSGPASHRRLIGGRQFPRAGHAEAKISQQTIAHGVNPPMHRQRLPARPGVLNAGGLARTSRPATAP